MATPTHRARFVRALATTTLFLGVAGCATLRSDPLEDDSEIRGGVMISAHDIANSRARNAFEAIERARTHLLVQETQGTSGTDVRLIHRGIDSLVSDPQIMVVVDGTPVSAPIERLRSIPAESIAYIKVLSGREATPRFGTLAGNGLILVRTRAIS